MHLVKTIRPPGQFKRSVTNESNDCCVPKADIPADIGVALEH